MAYFSLRRILRHAPPGTLFHGFEHAVAFAVLALLLLPLGRSRVQESAIVLVIFSLAAGLEWRQHQMFRNVRFEWWDVRDDAIGVLAAWLLLRVVQRKLI